MEIKTGLWAKQSKNGNTYYYGKIKIGDREFTTTLFKNDKRGNEKAPDFNIIMRDNINSQETQKVFKKEQKNSESGQIKPQQFVVDDVFEEFGNMLEQSDTEIAF